MPSRLRHWIKDQRPIKKHKTNRSKHFGDDSMAIFGVPSKHLLVPSAPSRKLNQRISGRPQNDFDEFLSSDAERELNRSFASTMSIHSPTRGDVSLAFENENRDYVPMDISPAPPYVQPTNTFLDVKPAVGRPRAFTSSARLFGRDMSNASVGSTSGLSLAPSPSSGTSSGNKKLQRSALPLEWTRDAHPAQSSQNILFPQPHDAPPSPAASDAMDVDDSYIHIHSTSAPLDPGPLSAASTITTFKINRSIVPAGPLSAAPTTTTFNQLFYDAMSPRRSQRGHDEYEESVSGFTVDESPVQPCQKKRRSDSPQPEADQQSHLALDSEPLSSSPAPMSSPSAHKLERICSGPVHQTFKKPILSGLGAPIALNINNKRPRRPVHSAMLPPGDASVGKENDGELPLIRHHLPPVRRAFSAMLPPTLPDQSLSSEDGSFEGPDMSSPAQAYAKRQQVKTVRRCDGTDDFRPGSGATALVQRDTQAMRRGLRRSEVRIDRAVERDTPRSKYLDASGLGGFGDNEAHGKILPCHRVKDDGLMRINSKTLNDLLDGHYDSQIEGYHVIDCRFEYEHKGGHVPGAINLKERSEVEDFFLGGQIDKPEPSTSGDLSKKTIIVFHCEFSVQRAPAFAKHLRATDRSANSQFYPKIHYPEVYILEGGYSQYFVDCKDRCEPRAYVTMNDPNFADSRRGDMDQFRRKAKFGRTRSYAYGEGKGGMNAELQHPKRVTAPSAGTSTLFAAANAARSRRHGMLGTLQEDSSSLHQSDDDDTDIGDSPCPPPTKGAGLKGKKMVRAPLQRAETYGPSRTVLGF